MPLDNKPLGELALQYKRLRNAALFAPARSYMWKEYIRTLRCCRCGAHPTEPHHIFGSMGSLKSSDLCTVPVCRKCHNYYEAHPQANHQLVEVCFVIYTKWISDHI